MSQFKALVYGEAGTGKTYSCITLLEAGQKIRFLAAERNALSGILAAKNAYKKAIPEDAISIMVPPRTKRSMNDFVKQNEKRLLTPVATQLTTVDPDRKKYDRYLNVLKGMSNFIDMDTGKDYGAIETWGPDTTLVVDGLTIICEAIQQMMIGGKLGTTQPEFLACQQLLIDLLRMLTEDMECNIVMVAHPDKDIDAITGKQTIYPANIGKALNNKIPAMFTDVMWAYREKDQYLWSTDDIRAVTRASNLKVASSMKQDYTLFFK